MKAEIEIHGADKGTIKIDGQDVSKAVRSLTMESAAGEPTRLTLDLLVLNGAEFAEVDVVIPTATVETLIALGWTPPNGEVKS